MVVFTKKLGYTYKTNNTNTGIHKTNTVDVFEIHIGTKQSLEDRVITFAHEIGHALDLAHNPMSIPEKHGWHKGISKIVVTREVAAWRHGRQLLRDMSCYKYVEDRYLYMEESGIASYEKALAAKKLGKV
jgi:hypothetical protein